MSTKESIWLDSGQFGLSRYQWIETREDTVVVMCERKEGESREGEMGFRNSDIQLNHGRYMIM